MHAAMRDHRLARPVSLGHSVDQLLPVRLVHRPFVNEPAGRVPQRPVPETLVRTLEIVRMIRVDVDDLETGVSCPGMRPAPSGVVRPSRQSGVERDSRISS